MLDRGKLAVLTIFALGLAAAAAAWWFNYQRGRRTLDFYGRDAALMIRTAPQIELLELLPMEASGHEEAGQSLVVGAIRLQIARRLDISRAKGLIHARTSLLDDSGYEWTAPAANCQPKIDYAVRFTGPTTATLAFDFGCQRAWFVERQRDARLIPKVAEGWQSFLQRQRPSQETRRR